MLKHTFWNRSKQQQENVSVLVLRWRQLLPQDQEYCKRARNIDFFTVPTLHDSENFTNDTTEKCYLRLIQCIAKLVYWS